jgi:hypothetical protein
MITAGLLGVATAASATEVRGGQETASIRTAVPAEWHWFNRYQDWTPCVNTGSTGVSQGRWDNYRCKDAGFGVVLYVYY